MSNLSSESSNEIAVSQSKVTWGAHLVVTLIIFAIAGFIIKGMFDNKPKARRWGQRPPPSVGVETAQLQATNYPIWIESYGSAEPLTRTNLVSDVNGRVISVADNIRAGASFSKGDVLLNIDPRDFQVEVDVAKSAVADALVAYKQELAQAEIAERDWNVRPGSEAGKDLALRKPQVAAALASYDAAKARLAAAELNLERTQVRAPFDGKVLRQMVDVGQVVNPSQAIAEIYSTDFIEVRLPVKAQDLANVTIPDEFNNLSDEQLPRVLFEGELGSKTYVWEGKLVRSEGAFDAATRMLFVVARIDNPFMASENLPGLRVGQFLRAKIQGKELINVYAIPRRAVSQNNMVAIAEEGVLQKRQVTPLWTDANSVVVSAAVGIDSMSSGNAVIKPTDKLILTPTANLAAGTRVKPLNEGGDEPAGRPGSRFAGEGEGKGEQKKRNKSKPAGGEASVAPASAPSASATE
ncbi:MAG: efflux RND transporter periplasmic adaptor subunit [Kangiellaceae bacterium]|jgi:RND family efflux transporter MFP subunit|nr:efflux RND transporter periplasmic adaptor subunit [Kangiellaceae bacterium]